MLSCLFLLSWNNYEIQIMHITEYTLSSSFNCFMYRDGVPPVLFTFVLVGQFQTYPFINNYFDIYFADSGSENWIWYKRGVLDWPIDKIKWTNYEYFNVSGSMLYNSPYIHFFFRLYWFRRFNDFLKIFLYTSHPTSSSDLVLYQTLWNWWSMS